MSAFYYLKRSLLTVPSAIFLSVVFLFVFNPIKNNNINIIENNLINKNQPVAGTSNAMSSKFALSLSAFELILSLSVPFTYLYSFWGLSISILWFVAESDFYYFIPSFLFDKFFFFLTFSLFFFSSFYFDDFSCFFYSFSFFS